MNNNLMNGNYVTPGDPIWTQYDDSNCRSTGAKVKWFMMLSPCRLADPFLHWTIQSLDFCSGSLSQSLQFCGWRFFNFVSGGVMSFFLSIISGWWFGTWILFSHILGMSSSQLTNSIIFQRGRSTTKQQPFRNPGSVLDQFMLLFEMTSPSSNVHHFTKTQIIFHHPIRMPSKIWLDSHSYGGWLRNPAPPIWDGWNPMFIMGCLPPFSTGAGFRNHPQYH